MLTNLISAKLAMQIPANITLYDATIADAIPQVDAMVKKWLQRNVEKVGACIAPTLAAGAATTGGSLAAETYYWVITALNLNGETTASNEVTGTTSGSNLTIPLTWNLVANAVSYNIYRGTSSDNENILVANIPSPFTTSYSDAGAIQGSGSPPSSNTAVAGMTEYLDGMWTDIIVLGDPPVKVSEITALYFDPQGNGGQNPQGFASTTLLTGGTDYYLVTDQRDGVTSLSGKIRRMGAVWQGVRIARRPNLTPEPQRGYGNIKVQYNGGWQIVPADLQRTCNVLVARMMGEGPNGFIYSTESTEDRSVTLPAGEGANNLMTPDILSRLEPYRRRKP